MSGVPKELRKAAEKRGLEVVEHALGHFHITGGPLLVNYYPFGKRRKAYVAGTLKAVEGVSVEQACDMALVPPPISVEKDKRRGKLKAKRAALIRRNGPKCHWCPEILTVDTSTIDHVIPIARGGLDNNNNRVLACAPCNRRRGHEMPEVKQPCLEVV